MQWHCAGCHAQHEFPDQSWGEVGEDKFCAATYPGRRQLPEEGLRVRLAAERCLPWLSPTPLPAGALGRISFRRREQIAPTPIVEFDDGRALLPNTEAHAVFPLLCGCYLPLWLEIACPS